MHFLVPLASISVEFPNSDDTLLHFGAVCYYFYKSWIQNVNLCID